MNEFSTEKEESWEKERENNKTIEEGRAASKSPHSQSQQAVSADIIPNSAVEILQYVRLLAVSLVAIIPRTFYIAVNF